MTWDLFISHASEDKAEVAEPLADMFMERGLKVWYDKYTLTVGDSLRRCIDRGLAECRYGLVILSKHFFSKEWTQKELDGLVAREDGSQKRILPVWHKVSRNEVVAFSPPLADKLGVSTAKGLRHVVDEVLRAIQVGSLPVQSTALLPKAQPPQTSVACSSSGNWVLLDTLFFRAQSVRQNGDGTLTLEIASETAEEDAAIQGLCQQAGPIAFAHRNDGLVVRVRNREAHSTSDQQVWTITVAPEKTEYGGGWMEGSLGVGGKTYSAEEIVTLRAGRILLNDPPAVPEKPGWPVENAILESHIQGTHTKLPIKSCILRAVYTQYKDRPQLFLPLARLAAIYALKAGDVVEQVLELNLGPIQAGTCHVKFRGRRRRKYSNVEPHTMQIEGECPLE